MLPRLAIVDISHIHGGDVFAAADFRIRHSFGKPLANLGDLLLGEFRDADAATARGSLWVSTLTVPLAARSSLGLCNVAISLAPGRVAHPFAMCGILGWGVPFEVPIAVVRAARVLVIDPMLALRRWSEKGKGDESVEPDSDEMVIPSQARYDVSPRAEESGKYPAGPSAAAGRLTPQTADRRYRMVGEARTRAPLLGLEFFGGKDRIESSHDAFTSLVKLVVRLVGRATVRRAVHIISQGEVIYVRG